MKEKYIYFFLAIETDPRDSFQLVESFSRHVKHLKVFDLAWWALCNNCRGSKYLAISRFCAPYGSEKIIHSAVWRKNWIPPLTPTEKHQRTPTQSPRTFFRHPLRLWVSFFPIFCLLAEKLSFFGSKKHDKEIHFPSCRCDGADTVTALPPPSVSTCNFAWKLFRSNGEKSTSVKIISKQTSGFSFSTRWLPRKNKYNYFHIRLMHT